MDFSDAKKRNAGNKYVPKMHFKQPNQDLLIVLVVHLLKQRRNSKICANRKY